EKFIGDAVMAVFGVPASHEDDATRALRAAVRMGARLDGLNQELERDYQVTLAMRIGVNTGEVVAVTTPRSGEGMVSGDAVNITARLEQFAAPGQILVGERTARAARGFRLRKVGALELRGKGSPVPAFELMGEEPGDRFRTLHLTAPMVGRGREMTLLRSLYERVAEEGRAHLVTIYG
ncbi:MAG TPA: hypothetical protein DIT48_10090, partial [Actinobacteria bacterium]|nr:hypothetical protein [Actinomycetota bacterium]